MYKLLSKVLTERLKGVIGKLVDAQQMTFIKGRQIMDAVLIANEAVDSRIKRKKLGIICKLDLRKHMIMSTGGFYNTQRGLRQGDPLSPFLFLITMEGLNSMIETTNNRAWLKGFDVAREGGDSLELTHLQCADDTLIFCDDEEQQLKYVRVILILFEGMTGLHINWRKSLVYPISTVTNMNYLAAILGGEIDTLPTTYLSMLLGGKFNSVEIWNGMLEKCEKKLARWKTQYLSFGGRLTLINSVLDVLPTYMMTLFPIPAGVIRRLDSIRRKFLWHGNKERKGFHLVKWKVVIAGKKVGGMGIKNLKVQSKALRMKWLWKFANENQMLWKRVINAKYEGEDMWMTKEVTTPDGVSL
ncbi:hypothetical protein MTR67_019743 [Solanum verrucosum]|uniref:Reverse transcriptase domain-containing protein n=1 Tax=Solanum verrucosum TaxID=315347 RepID=A0AAF0QQ63_SOLVR|nr:hypothetical protein MTR67_019743 [Solanum verrucosum]